MQPAGKGLVRKKILSLAFVAMLSLALAALFGLERVPRVLTTDREG
jgi:hypothetical protein